MFELLSFHRLYIMKVTPMYLHIYFNPKWYDVLCIITRHRIAVMDSVQIAFPNTILILWKLKSSKTREFSQGRSCRITTYYYLASSTKEPNIKVDSLET